MVKYISCPECSELGIGYLMLPQKEREYDEELEMPVTVYIHNVCKTQIRITGLVCIDCSGTGQCEGECTVTSWEHGHESTRIVKTVKDCPHCDGLGVIPKKFVIIPGDGTKPSRITHTSLESSVIGDGTSDLHAGSVTAANNDGRLFGCRRGRRGRRNVYTGNW